MAPATIPPSYIRVHAVVGMRRETDTQTDRQTDTQRHTDGRGYYTFRLGYASREM